MSSTWKIWIGMDVHKDSVMVAVFEDQRSEPEVVQRLPNEPRKLRRFFERWAKRGEIRSCYEASGAQHRLNKTYHRIAARKSSHIAVVAVARELVGFLWAVMRDLEQRTSHLTP